MKQLWKNGCVLLCMFLLLSVLSSCNHPVEVPVLSADPAVKYAMKVTFFSIGKADCILIETPASCVMIDTGTNGDGGKIASVLKQKGIRKIDCLFVTHFDKDHVGGADKILKQIGVDTVYEPDYDSNSKQTVQYRNALPESAQVLRLHENVSFSLDGIQYSVDVANGTFSGDEVDNDYSLIVRAVCGDISFYFMGDAEKDRLYELLSEDVPPSTVLKVAHHGKAARYSDQIYQTVNPRYAVITSSDDDPEDSSVTKMLEQNGADVLLTRKGRVEIITDGTGVSILQNPSLRP